MRRQTASALAAVLACLLPAAGLTARKVPAQLALARYVCLGYDTGQGFMSEQQSVSQPYDVYPEDRQALDAVRDALQKWGRYVLTTRAEDAELLIAVRFGRRGGGGAGLGGGSGTGRGQFGSLGSGQAELSSSDDLFTIYEARGGRAGTPLWRQQGHGLFAGSPPKAFAEFQADVEATPPPAQKPAGK
ncbi:MAG TPA: hypothetical protein VEQ10_22795 [Vicinamibacteria bacterium]|nr:hypothetical protein [Vicinamibacteria bacterium]